MRYFVLTITAILMLNCASSRTTSELPIRSEGIKIEEVQQNTFTTEEQQSVVKVMNGGSFSSTGSFISKQGLLLTNYQTIAPSISSLSSEDELIFTEGFSAADSSGEIKLQGITLHILIEQTDVTDVIRKDLSEDSRNYQIFQVIEQAKRDLINKRTTSETDLHVEISDIYSGNRHIMSVYKVIDDVRLVLAPKVDITTENIAQSSAVLDNIQNEFTLLRAYDKDGNALRTNSLLLSQKVPTSSDSLFALGYPGSTYRLDSKRTTAFYYANTNPYVLDAFKIYQKKEDSLSALNIEHALNSFNNRVGIEDQIRYFEMIQTVIAQDSILSKKQDREEELRSWIQADSLRKVSYGRVLSSIDQAIDIAEQSGDIYFATNYFSNLSLLDDLTNQFRAYIQQVDTLETDQDVSELKNRILQVQSQILQQMNIHAEMNMLGDFIYMVQSVPEDQRPLAVYDIFYGLSDENKRTVIDRFIDEQINNSFLFDPDKTIQILETNRFYNDPLFVILDEISSTLEFARSNYARHYPYLVPAQMLLTKAKLDKHPELPSDATTILSSNVGSIIGAETSADTDIFLASIDFSGKAPGTAILNADHELVGIITSEITESISANYLYQPESAFIKARFVQDFLNNLSPGEAAQWILDEINP